MDVKGQGALEYLLLIGGAVLVAAIVIALITGIPGTGPDPADAAKCAAEMTFTGCKAAVGNTAGFCCPIDSTGAETAAAANFHHCAYSSVDATGNCT